MALLSCAPSYVVAVGYSQADSTLLPRTTMPTQ